MQLIKKITAALAASVALVGSVFAQATLPAAAGTALTELQGQGEAMIDAAWPVIAAIVVGFVIFKLFKRAANKV